MTTRSRESKAAKLSRAAAVAAVQVQRSSYGRRNKSWKEKGEQKPCGPRMN